MDLIIRPLCSNDVNIINVSGSDLTPYQTARVSYGGDDTPSEEKLRSFLTNLFKNSHMVPFEHCSVTYTLKAPIFVFRQLFRYRTASISERSMRYCDAEPEVYLPTFGSVVNEQMYRESVIRSYNDYKELVSSGVSKEIARGVLPTSTFSYAIFTINLRNLFHLWDQRLDKHAQNEIRCLSFMMLSGIRRYFPVIHDIYRNSVDLTDFFEKNPAFLEN